MADNESNNGATKVISFEEISPADLAASEPRRDSGIAMMLEQFLATGRYAAAPILSDEEKSVKRAHSITAYARRWKKPVRAIYRRTGNKVILKRVDMTENGTAIPNWETGDEFLGNPNRRESAGRGGQTRKERAAAAASGAQRTPEGAVATRPNAARQPVAAGA